MNEKNEFNYDADSRFCPIPPSERGLAAVIAEQWLKIETDGNNDLEGTCFDRDGNLWFIESVASRAHKVDMKTGKDVVVYADPKKRGMSAVKFHKDGRVYIPSVGSDFKHGYVFSMNPDGTDYQIVIAGHAYNDLAFDSQGGFYYTHFNGDISNREGCVNYVTPDLKIMPLLKNLAGPNGVCMSTDEKTIWITELTSGQLLRVDLAQNPVDIRPFGVTVPYKFTGGVGPDSCEIDADDNLYVAMYGQGRVMVFNRNGCPIGQILIPGREKGQYMASTHMAIRPGTKEIYICANDPVLGAAIFRTKPCRPQFKCHSGI